MTRIVVFGDSLPLARPQEGDADAVYWEETWPWRLEHLLRRRGHTNEVINCSRRDRTVEAITNDEFLDHVAWKLPNVVIVQLGIVDCGPRIFSRFEKRLLNLPVVPDGLREALIARRSARRRQITARDPLAKVHVRPEAFRAALLVLGRRLNELPARPLCFYVPICCDPERMEKKSAGFMGNVSLYNSIIRETASQGHYEHVDHPTTAHDFWVDGYHLSPLGNARLAETLADVIAARIAQAPLMPRRYPKEG